MSKDTTTDGTILVDSENTYPFTIVPNYLITNKKLMCETRMTWIYLYSRINCKNWIARPTDIQRVLNISKYTWLKVSKEMQEHGYLMINKSKGTTFKFMPRARETVDFKPRTIEESGLDDQSAKTQPGAQRGAQSAKTQSAKTHSAKTHCIERKDLLENKDHLEKKDLLHKNEIQKIFDEMWKLYPLKKAKQRAMASLTKHLEAKTRVEAEDMARMIWNGLTACVTEHEAKTQIRNQGGDIWVPELPHLTTWLNQSRWEDSYDEPSSILQNTRRKPGILDATTLFK